MAEQSMNSEQYPKITVVTPSYNQAQFLRESIESVLNQNYPNLEYFVVDGASTDGSVDIIREYEDHIDWWVSEKDKNHPDALNKGFSRATGEIIGFINSDDALFPGALERVAKAYRRTPNASVFVGGIAIGAFNDGPIDRCRFPPPPAFWLRRYYLAFSAQPGTFYNREIYFKVGGINSDIYMSFDGDLHYRLLQYDAPGVLIKEMQGFIRWHGITKSSTGKLVDLYWQEIDEFRQRVGITGWRRYVMPQYHRLTKLVTGTHALSLLKSRQYRGKRMSDVWQDYLGTAAVSSLDSR